MAFPTSLSNVTDGVTEILAAHINNLEAKVGVDASAVTTSHDYKLSGVTGSDKAASKAGAETLTNKTLPSPVINTGISGTAITDEDDMASDSASKVPTQQSVKAYVTAQIAAAISAAKSALYPIGHIYASVVATNPGTLLGFGTWVAYGAGRVMVGHNAADTDFDTAEETGGEKTHTLSEAEMPVHTHVQNSHTHVVNGSSGTGSGAILCQSSDDGANTIDWNTDGTVATNQNAGSGAAHNNLQPYIVTYLWKRTA